MTQERDGAAKLIGGERAAGTCDTPASECREGAILGSGDGEMRFLGERAIFVPRGMTAEMVLAGARVLEERVPDYVTSGGRIGQYSARLLMQEVWVAILLAAAEPSAEIASRSEQHS